MWSERGKLPQNTEDSTSYLYDLVDARNKLQAARAALRMLPPQGIPDGYVQLPSGILVKDNLDETIKYFNIDGLANLKLDIIEKMEKAFSLSNEIFSPYGLVVPKLVDFIAKRSDIYTVLADEDKQMERDGQKPMWILTPNLNAIRWQEILGDKYKLFDWQEDNATELQKQSKQRLKTRGSTMVEMVNSNANPTTLDPKLGELDGLDSTIWTMSIIPATDKPQDLGKSYNDINGITCTISEYNTMQTYLLAQGKEPVDKDTWTWQYGKIGNCSPFGDFGRGASRVCARCDFSGSRGSYVGCRPPGVG